MPIEPPWARLVSSDSSRASAAKSSPASARFSASSARVRRSATTASVALSGTLVRICATSICAPTPTALRRFSINSSISASLILMRFRTSRSRTRSTMSWSRMLSRNFA